MAHSLDDLVVALEDALYHKQNSENLQTRKTTADINLNALVSRLVSIEQALRTLEGESGLPGFRTSVQQFSDTKITLTEVQSRIAAQVTPFDNLESDLNAVEVGVRMLEQGLLDYMTQTAE